jgi:polyisoprenoid-binding protein YceI
MPARNITTLPTGRWVVDLTRTTVTFTVRGAFGSTVTGTVPVTNASVTSTGTGLDVAAQLDLGALDTGNPRRDRDLRKPRLLDLDAHPTASFTGRATDATALVIDGVLAVRGRDVPLRLEVTVADGAQLAPGGTVSAVATTTLDRRDLGISAPAFMIGRRVDVTVSATLVPDAPD